MIRASSPAIRMTPFRMSLAAYFAMAVLAFGLSELRGETLVITTPAWALSSELLVASSVLLGLIFALGTIVMTRLLVTHVAAARRLHEALRPAVSHLSMRELAAVGVLGSVAEELFFRGLLAPWLGVVASSLVFGILHQVRGDGRFVWMLWAVFVGAVFALIFVYTGSLAGPIVGHIAINVVNLRYLQGTDHASERSRSRLGLLLNQS